LQVKRHRGDAAYALTVDLQLTDPDATTVGFNCERSGTATNNAANKKGRLVPPLSVEPCRLYWLLNKFCGTPAVLKM
jgi:hypothetical protein